MSGFQKPNLDIVTLEHTEQKHVLRTKALEVTFPLNEKDKALIEAMKSKLHQLGGVGLAAPQANCSKQIIALFIPEDAALLREHVKPYPMHVMINPTYEALADTAITHDFEACYSVTEKAGKVPRYEQINLSYYDEFGQYHQQIESGFYARVLQHEIDHLQGILIIDRLVPGCIQGSIEEMMVLRRSELSEEKRILYDELMAKKK